MKLLHLLLVPMGIMVLSGCAPKEVMVTGDKKVSQGKYREAAKIYSKAIDKGDRTQRNNLLWYLNTGLSYRFDHNSSGSIKAFDESEWLIKHYQEQLLHSDVGQSAASILVNDTTRPYTGTQYDGVMANTYKAINYMELGDMPGARVEFNRAIDRQRRAKAFYAKMIEKNRQAIAKEEKKDNKGVRTDDSMPVADKELQQKYPSLYNFEAYPDFINPIVSYLAGIFALSDGDKSKAQYLFKEAYGMNQHSQYLAEDLKFVDAGLDGYTMNHKGLVWVIIEDGLAPVKTEWRMDIPVWILSNNLNYISLALPKIHKRKSAFSGYSIANQDKVSKAETVSDMDRVIMTEFKKEFPSVLRRAIFSATTKAVVQYEMQRQAQNNDGNAGLAFAIASIATTVYTVASAQADTRTWTTLPKRFDVIRLERPDDGKIAIKTSTGLSLEEIELPLSEYTLVYVKMPTSGAKPSVSVIPLGRR